MRCQLLGRKSYTYLRYGGAIMRFLSFLLSLALVLSMAAAYAQDLPFQVWRTQRAQPRFGLLCIHGLGLNSNSYDDFAKRIARHGGEVYAIDVRGFGAWMQTAGHDKVDFDGCLSDIQKALTAIHQKRPGMPVFLLGESMGGAIALRATAMYPDLIQGLISSVPAAERFDNRRTDVKVAMHILRPRKNINIGSQIVEQASTATRNVDGKKEKVVNEKLRESWENDPLNRMELSPKELIQFQAFMNDNHDSVKKITDKPVLFVQGLDDQLVKPEGTFELVQEIGTPFRMFIALPTRHLIFEQTESADARINRASTQMVLAWINAHISAEEPVGADDSKAF
jgi:alpha-beta hydrolase superfamily lysophospholipase